MDQTRYTILLYAPDDVQPTTGEIREALYALLERKVKDGGRQVPYSAHVAFEDRH